MMIAPSPLANLVEVRVDTLQDLLRRVGSCVTLDGIYGPELSQASSALGMQWFGLRMVVFSHIDYRTKVRVDGEFFARLKREAQGRSDQCPLTARSGSRNALPSGVVDITEAGLDTGSPRRVLWPWLALGAGVLLAGGLGYAVYRRGRRRRRRRR